MKFFKHWALGEAPVDAPKRPFTIRCCGGSNASVEDAARRATELARRAAAAIVAGESLHYAYADRPLREDVIEAFSDGAEPYAVLTRNRYGSLVLNTAGALFADIDDPPLTAWERLKLVFRRRHGGPGSAHHRRVVERVAAIAAAGPGSTIRLYRTRNGFRCLVIDRLYEPGSDETECLLEAFGSDPLFVRLCRAQACFRARVSPKFWRCGAPRPPRGIPWPTEKEERAYRAWEKDYERTTTRYATCAFVASFGDRPAHPTAQKVLEIHDRLACRGDRPLA